jgi:hypothetical protein
MAHILEPVAESLQPRGEGGFFVRLVQVIWFARAVSHALRPRKFEKPYSRRP